MPSILNNQHGTRPRALFGVVLAGIVALLMQMLSPALAADADGVWMEICSDAGAVWVLVDADPDTGPDTGDTGECPDCAKCSLCGVTEAPQLPGQLWAAQVRFEQATVLTKPNTRLSGLRAGYWAEGRGPPSNTEDKTMKHRIHRSHVQEM